MVSTWNKSYHRKWTKSWMVFWRSHFCFCPNYLFNWIRSQTRVNIFMHIRCPILFYNRNKYSIFREVEGADGPPWRAVEASGPRECLVCLCFYWSCLFCGRKLHTLYSFWKKHASTVFLWAAPQAHDVALLSQTKPFVHVLVLFLFPCTFCLLAVQLFSF